MYISTECFGTNYTEKESIKILADVGFDAINYAFVTPKFYNGEMSDEECMEYYADLKKYAEGYKMVFNQAHAPYPSGSSNPEEADRLFNNIVRSMRNASYLGIKTIVVHGIDYLDYNADGGAQQLFEMNMNFYTKLKPYCEKYEIRIALENIFKTKRFLVGERGENSVCSTPQELIRYLDALNSECFTACLNIGHALITGQKPEEFIRMLGKKRLTALQVNDNNGLRDWHTLPYGGVADWTKIMKALNEIGYTGDLTLDAGNFLTPLPKELYPAGAELMVSVAKHLRDIFYTQTSQI